MTSDNSENIEDTFSDRRTDKEQPDWQLTATRRTDKMSYIGATLLKTHVPVDFN